MSYRSVVLRTLFRALDDDPYRRLHDLLDEAETRIAERSESDDWKRGAEQAIQFVRGKMAGCWAKGDLHPSTVARIKRELDGKDIA